MADKETVLVKHAYSGSTCRLPVEQYNKAVADAEELGRECVWIIADEAGQDSPTFDDLDAEGQKEVKAAQAERQKKFDAKQAANE